MIPKMEIHKREIRQDIQGLRAIAVLLVILFHAGIDVISGGYIGVDIFFVISGYLITSHILSDFDGNKFNFKKFYVRRFFRLYPALISTVSVTIAVGAILMTPADLEALAQSSIAALTAVSNIAFFMQSGYFDSNSLTKPLLHTWSLGVEEQFYLLWPAFIFVMGLLQRKYLCFFILSAALASLIAATIAQGNSASFFLMPYRIYEFSIGALIVWIPPIRATLVRSVLSTIGAVSIFVCAILYNEKTIFPSYMALLPALATALLITSGAPGLVGIILKSKIMVWVGNISYSLYLVHWPITTFILYRNTWKIDLLSTNLIILTSFLLATIQYNFIEKPFRRSNQERRSWKVFACLASAALAISISASAWASGGWPWRLPSEIRKLAMAGSKVTKADVDTWKAGSCFVGSRFASNDAFPTNFDFNCLRLSEAKPNILLVGDSTAAHLVYGLENQYPEINFLQATVASCRPFFPTATGFGCDQLVKFLDSKFLPQENGKIDAIVIAAYWRGRNANFEKLSKAVDRFGRFGIPVVVIGDQVGYTDPFAKILVSYGRLRGAARVIEAKRRKYEKATNPKLKEMIGARAIFVDPHDFICNPRCAPFINGNLEKPITRDGIHLTPDGSVYLAQAMRSHGFLSDYLPRQPAN